MNPRLFRPAVFLWALLWGSVAAAAWRIDPPSHDFGEMSDMSPRSHDFLVVNEGTNDLRVGDIVLSCERCLSYTLSHDVIPPGEAGVLTVRLDPVGYRGDVEFSVVVSADDPQAAQRSVGLRARVQSAFSLVGQPLVLLGVQIDEVRSGDMTLRADPAAPVLRHIATDYPGLSARIEPGANGSTYHITASTRPPQPRLGLLRPRIYLLHRLDEPPVYAIPVTLEVIPPFHVSPKEVVFDAVDREQFRILFVTQAPEHAVDLADVQVPGDHFRAEIVPEFGLPNYRINLYAYGLEGAEGMVDEIRILTKAPADNTFVVPVRVRPPGSGAPAITPEARP